jgi:hypothetical protein
MLGHTFRAPNIACTVVPSQSAPFSNQDVIAITFSAGHVSVHRADRSAAGSKRVLAYDDYSLVKQFTFEMREKWRQEIRVWSSMFGIGELHGVFTIDLRKMRN